jgi:hypothetical protein
LRCKVHRADKCNIGRCRAPRLWDHCPGPLRGNLVSRFRAACKSQVDLGQYASPKSVQGSMHVLSLRKRFETCLVPASIGGSYQTRTPRVHTSRACPSPRMEVGYCAWSFIPTEPCLCCMQVPVSKGIRKWANTSHAMAGVVPLWRRRMAFATAPCCGLQIRDALLPL